MRGHLRRSKNRSPGRSVPTLIAGHSGTDRDPFAIINSHVPSTPRLASPHIPCISFWGQRQHRLVPVLRFRLILEYHTLADAFRPCAVVAKPETRKPQTRRGEVPAHPTKRQPWSATTPSGAARPWSLHYFLRLRSSR